MAGRDDGMDIALEDAIVPRGVDLALRRLMRALCARRSARTGAGSFRLVGILLLTWLAFYGVTMLMLSDPRARQVRGDNLLEAQAIPLLVHIHGDIDGRQRRSSARPRGFEASAPEDRPWLFLI